MPSKVLQKLKYNVIFGLIHLVQVLDLGKHRTIFDSEGATALSHVFIPDTADFYATVLANDSDVTPERERSLCPAQRLEGAALADVYPSSAKCVSCNGVPWILSAFEQQHRQVWFSVGMMMIPTYT